MCMHFNACLANDISGDPKTCFSIAPSTTPWCWVCSRTWILIIKCTTDIGKVKDALEVAIHCLNAKLFDWNRNNGVKIPFMTDC